MTEHRPETPVQPFEARAADQEQRRQAVAAMIGCQALAGIVKRSPAQQARLQRYIAGEPIETLLEELRDEQRQRQGQADCE